MANDKYEKIWGRELTRNNYFSIFAKSLKLNPYGLFDGSASVISSNVTRIELNVHQDELDWPTQTLVNKLREKGHEILALPGDVAGHFVYPII